MTKYVPDYVVFDLETTGINPVSDDIIEISALKVVNGKIVEEFSSLINPGRPIPYQATRVNHITDKMVENAPDLEWGIQKFLDFTGSHMSKKCLPQLPGHKLVDIAAYFGLDTSGAHRALQDCIMNQQCYEEMGKLQEHMTMVLCPKCGGEMVRRNGMFGEFYGCINFPRCRFTKNIR